MKNNNKIIVFALSFMLIFSMIGCGKKDEITPFKDSLQTFYDKVNEISISINSIDPNSTSASENMLKCLDDMNQTFDALAEIDVPAEFEETKPLIQSAITNMHNANNLYHQAYSNQSYDDVLAQNAQSYYSDALASIKNIGEILMGHDVVPSDN